MAEGVRAGTHSEGWRERIRHCRSCNTETTDATFVLADVRYELYYIPTGPVSLFVCLLADNFN